jgi:hypothetical protein
MGFTDMPFDIPNLRAENGEAVNHVRIGWMRSVANIYHAFAICSFADECAHAAGRDPKDYLLDLIGPPRNIDLKAQGVDYPNMGPIETYPVDTGRLRKVIEIAAEKSGWGKRTLPKGHALGIAAHRSFLSYIATVVEVAVTPDGKISIPRVDTVVDAGMIVNPDRVRSQFEGAAVFGASLTLMGEITATAGKIDQSNYNNYPVARINQAPYETRVHIVETDAPPAGVGEPGVPPFAPGALQRHLRRHRQAHSRVANRQTKSSAPLVYTPDVAQALLRAASTLISRRCAGSRPLCREPAKNTIPKPSPIAIRSPAPATVVALRRHERAFRTAQEVHHRRDLFRSPCPPHGNPIGHILHLLRRQLIENPRPHHRRRDGVHANSVRRQFLPQRFRQPDHTRLRGRISDHPRIAFLPGDRRDVHDAPISALAHVRNHRPAEIKDRREIERDIAVPILIRLFPDGRRLAGHPRVVHQNVDPPRAREHRRHRPFHLRRFRDVRANRKSAAANGRRHPLAALEIEIHDRDSRAGSGQSRRDGLSDARRPTCHNGRLALQRTIHSTDSTQGGADANGLPSAARLRPPCLRRSGKALIGTRPG